jgi:hypothetical protein
MVFYSYVKSQSPTTKPIIMVNRDQSNTPIFD